MNLTFRSIGVWLCFLTIALINGAIREVVLINFMRIAPTPANQLSCFTGALLFTIILFCLWKKLGIKSMSQAASVGAGWVISTALFETFVLNRRLPWPKIAHTYNVAAGEFWPLVLIWLGVMPILFYAYSDQTDERL